MKLFNCQLVKITSMSIILLFGMVSSCNHSSGPETAEVLKSDTVYETRIDTVMVFDPETQHESVHIFKYSDTIVKGASISRYSDTILGEIKYSPQNKQ